MAAYQLVKMTFGDGTNRELPIRRSIDYLFVGDKIISTDEDLTTFVSAGHLKVLTAAQVATQGGADQVVTPIEDGEPTSVQVASDGAVALTSEMGVVYLDESTTGAKAISTTSSVANQVVAIFMAAVSGGSYTLVVDGGVLTFDAALEYARIQRNAQNDGWNAIDLIGATVV